MRFAVPAGSDLCESYCCTNAFLFERCEVWKIAYVVEITGFYVLFTGTNGSDEVVLSDFEDEDPLAGAHSNKHKTQGHFLSFTS